MTAIATRRPRRPAPPPKRAAAAPLVLLTAVAWPVLASYAATVAVAAVLVVSAGSDFSLGRVVVAGAPLWAAAHQVPLSITLPGAEPGTLGVLPLLPTIALAVLVARSAAGAMGRLGWHGARRAATVALTFAVAHGALGAAIALGRPLPRLTVEVWPATLACAGVAGAAALVGAIRAGGLARTLAGSVPPWAVRGTLAGLRGLGVLLAGGVLLLLVGLVASLGTAGDVLASWSGTPGGRFGAIAVSVLYAPNAVVAAVSWAVGPGLSIGAVASGPFGTTAGALPAVPLLAALPEPTFGPWGAVALALPAFAGVVVGRAAGRWSAAVDLSDRLRAVSLAGAVAAVGCAVLAAGSGGRLGGGAFGVVTVPAGAIAVVVFVWLVAGGVVTVAAADRAARHAALAAVVAEARAGERAAVRAGAAPDDGDLDDTADRATGDRGPGTARRGIKPDTAGSVPAKLDRATSARAESGAAKSGAAKPDAAKPGSVESGAATSGAVQPDTVKSGAVQPDTATSGAVQPDTVKSGAMTPGAVRPSMAKPGARLSVVKPAAQPAATPPGEAKPIAAKPGAAQPAASRSGAAKPGAAEPGAAEPGAAKPGADGSGS